MIKILHIIDFLCLGGAARSMIAISKYSSRLDSELKHSVISLKKPDPKAIRLAEESGMVFCEADNEQEQKKLIEDADIVHIHYWNNPQIFAFLHQDLPPTRLIIWFHVAGDNAPQVITRDLINYADIAIPCNPYSYDLPVFHQLNPEVRSKKVRMVYDAADFERVSQVEFKPHDTFNVGYIGGLSFTKMHPGYIAMSANANIKTARFILCGGGQIDLLKQQASELNALNKFDFRGFVEDISIPISEFDVYGYPLCEDTYAAAELNLQEVMYVGVPPVVFPHGGIKQLVINNYTGLVVNSEAEYSEALEYLYHHPEERSRLGKNARNYAEQIFGAENASRQLNPIYRKLLNQPKRDRKWGIPTDSRLLDEPLMLLDVVEIPPQFAGAKAFVESISDRASQFVTSLISKDWEEALEADDRIRYSSILLGLGEGSVAQYTNYYPNDGYLHFWLGLILEGRGDLNAAMSQLAHAVNSGCNHIRAFWYLAQIAEALQDISVMQQALDNLKQIAPQFQPAIAMKLRLNKLIQLASDLSNFNLSEINYLSFPDWSLEEEILTANFHTLLRTLAQENDRPVTLLIDITGITEEEANLFLSSVALNLMMEEDLEVSENLNFSLIQNLSETEWDALLPEILARIQLDQEKLPDQETIESLPVLSARYPNYLIYPDWNQDSDRLTDDLTETLKKLAEQEDNAGACVLIDITGMDPETIGLYLSELVMTVLLNEGIDLNDRLQISLIGDLNTGQWDSLKSLGTIVSVSE